jgi:TRAP-type transport system periplasmic protein
MFRVVMSVILAAGVLAAAGCGSTTRVGALRMHDGQIVLRFAHYLSTTHIVAANALNVWIDEVEKRSNGKVRIDYYPGGQLVDAVDTVSAVRTGAVDISFITVANSASAELPLSDVTAVPGIETASLPKEAQWEAYWKILNGILLDADFRPQGLRPLMGILPGNYQVLSEAPIRNVDEWRGLTVRSAGGASDFTLHGLGAIPVHLSATDVYEALQRKTIEATINTLEGIPSYDFDEVAHAASTNAPFGGGAQVVMINDAVWQALPADVQEAMMQARVIASKSLAKAYDEKYGPLLKKIAEKMDFYELSPEELARMQPAMLNAQREWVSQRERFGKPGQAALDAWVDALDEQRRAAPH